MAAVANASQPSITIAELLRRAKRAQKLTNADLCAKLGVSRDRLDSILNSNAELRLTEAWHASRLTGLSMTQLAELHEVAHGIPFGCTEQPREQGDEERDGG